MCGTSKNFSASFNLTEIWLYFWLQLSLHRELQLASEKSIQFSLTSTFQVSMAGLKARQASAGGGGLVHPLSIFSTEHLGQSGLGPGCAALATHWPTASWTSERGTVSGKTDSERVSWTLLKEDAHR